MDNDKMQRYRTTLEDLLHQIQEGLDSSAETTRPVSPDKAIGRLTRVDAIQSQHMAMAVRQRQQVRLQQIRQALARIDAGTFGTCIKCGDEIGEIRLEVAPESALCIKCAR